MYSTNDSLIPGKNYLVNADGFISSSEASVASGVVSGYTKTTITIGGETYSIASDAKFTMLNDDTTASSIALADVFMGNVEFLVKDSKVTSVLLLGPARFSASYESAEITVTALDTLKDVDSFKMTELAIFDTESESFIKLDVTAIDETELSGENFSFMITLDQFLVPGDYLVTVEVNDTEFVIELTA